MRRSLIALALSTLAACSGGDGGNSGSTKLSFTSVTSFGASLTDSGTFGYKATVQPAEGETIRLWNERVAAAYGIDTTCAVYAYTGSGFNDDAGTTGCSNYAIAGSVVQNFVAAADPANDSVDNASPVSILKQLADGAADATANGGYDAHSLVLVGGDSGANDVAGLLTYLLYASQGDSNYQQHFAHRVLSILPPGSDAYTQAATALGNGDLPTAGGIYMVALADTLAATVQATVLDVGATHVVVQNTLDVTKTPKFQLGIPQQLMAGGMSAEDAQAKLAQIEALAQAWLTAYNHELAARLGDDERVVFVDFYTHFNNEMADPAQYGLSNVTMPACALTSAGDDLSLCTSMLLSASVPANESGADWWKTYVFANSFHPTPYGHQLLAEMVTDELAKAGWL